MSDSFLVIKDEEGKYISYQQDDLDGDGTWDEIALIFDLKAGEEEKLFFRERPSVISGIRLRF